MNSQTIDVSKLHPTSREFVKMAIQCGWLATNGNSHSVLLTSPATDGRYQTISVVQGAINQRAVKQWVRKVRLYGDSTRIASVLADLDDFEMFAFGKRKTRHFTFDKDSPMNAEDTAVPAQYPIPAPSRAVRDAVAVGVISAPTPLLEPQRPSGRRVISEHPWIARKNSKKGHPTGNGYPSHSTIQRNWSDGAIDYRCAQAGCDYINDKPVSVSRHYGHAVGHIHPDKSTLSQRQVVQQVVIPGYEPARRPVGDRAKRLAREIAEAMDYLKNNHEFVSGEGVMAVAEKIAGHITEERDRRRETEEPTGPMTAEQIIEKVRRLVDGGAYLAQMERSSELEIELAALRDRAESAERARDEIASEWEALRDLLNRPVVS